MTASEFKMGYKLLQEIFGDHGAQALDQLDAVAPESARAIVDHSYQATFGRDPQSPRDIALATIAALTALGRSKEHLASHIRGGLVVGLKRSEIIEAITQLALYVGFPASINAARIAKEVFEEQNIDNWEAH